MLHIAATTLTQFWGRGDPLPIADATVAQNVITVGFGNPTLPLCQFSRGEIGGDGLGVIWTAHDCDR